MLRQGPTLHRIQVPYHPWTLFGIFTVSHAALSYLSLPLVHKLWIGLFGLALPFGLALWTLRGPRPHPTPGPGRTLGPLIPPWGWALFLALLFFRHFYRLTEVPSWPHADEATLCSIAMDPEGPWRLFIGENQWEPMFGWLLACFFKIVPPSLFSMRLFPTIISLLTVLACYGVVRRFWGPFPGFVAAWLMAFSFWPFVQSRLTTHHGLFTLWEILGLGALGWMAKGKDTLPGLIALGLVLGSGFYVFTTWPLTALALGGGALYLLFHRRPDRRTWGHAALLLLVSGSLMAPMALARLSPGGMAHIQTVLQVPAIPLQWAKYFACLFWEGFGSAPWGPAWGGFLDPILGALVFLGALEVARKASLLWLGGLGLGSALFLMPAAMAGAFSPLRITGLFPVLLLCAVLGLSALLPTQPKARTFGVLFFVLVPSTVLDLRHYLGPYAGTIQYSDYSLAYPTLKDQYERSGPFYFFSEFSLDYDDRTLAVACRPFNAFQEEERGSEKPPDFAVLLVKVDYAPYLVSKFPGTGFKELPTHRGKGSRLATGLFLIPTQGMGESTLRAWGEADRVCRGVHGRIKNKSHHDPWGEYARMLLASRNAFQDDPFLRTLLWEKVGFFRYLGGDLSGAVEAYDQALRQGLGIPHLSVNRALAADLAARQGVRIP